MAFRTTDGTYIHVLQDVVMEHPCGKQPVTMYADPHFDLGEGHRAYRCPRCGSRVSLALDVMVTQSADPNPPVWPLRN